MNEFILKYQGKELIMPEWGDFGYRFLLYKNQTHELNTKFNGLFKDCVYGEGSDIAVKVGKFKFRRNVYKIGDVLKIIEDNKPQFEAIQYDNITGFYVMNGLQKDRLAETINEYEVSNIGNLLDEYFEGKNELAKMVGFD